MGKEELNDSTDLNGWLESWKKTYRVREKRLCCEAELMMFVRQLSRLGSSNYQACVRDINDRIYWIWTNLDSSLRLNQKKDWQRKKRKVKAGKNWNNKWQPCLLWQLMDLLFSNLLLFDHQKYQSVLDLSKIRQDQCLFIIFEIAKHGWIVISWRLFLAD